MDLWVSSNSCSYIGLLMTLSTVCNEVKPTYLSFLRWTFTVSLKHPYPEWYYLAVFCSLNFSPLAFYLPSARVIHVCHLTWLNSSVHLIHE